MSARSPAGVGERTARRPPWGTLGLAAAGAGLGAAVAALGVRQGPWLPLALALLALLALAALARPVWAVALVVVAMPVGALEVGVGPDGVPVIHLAVVAAAALVALGRLAGGQAPLPWPGELWWAAALAGLAVAGTPLAVDPDAALKQDAQLVVGMLAALSVVAAVRGPGDLRRLVGATLAVGTVLCLAALPAAAELRPRLGGAVVENRAHGLFTEPNQLGSFAALLLLVACGLWLGGRLARVRLAAALVVTVAAGALALSLSRGAWLGAAVGTLGLAVLLPAARRRLLVTGGLALAGLAAVLLLQPGNQQLGVIGARLGTLSDPSGNPWDARPAIWREAGRQIRERPLTGSGPGGFPAAAASPQSQIRAFDSYHAHDVPLTVAAEGGLPAAAALVGLTLAVGRAVPDTVGRLLDRGAARDAALVAGLGAALLTVVGHGLVDVTLRHPVIAVAVWLQVGLVLAAARVARAAEVGR